MQVKVNAFVDEGIAELVSVISCIPNLETIESCQGGYDERKAFVLFRLKKWRDTGQFLFDRLLPKLSPDLRSQVALSIRAYDNDNAIASIEFDAMAMPELINCIKTLLPISASVPMARNTHRLAIT